MNDAEHRYPSDGLDDAARFAEIIAHMNDDLVQDERVSRTRRGDAAPLAAPAPDSATPDSATADSATADSLAPEGAAPESEAAEGEAPDGAELWDQPPEDVTSDMTEDRTPQVWRAHEVDEADDEHFEPLPLAPLPVGDLQFWAIIVGMGGGPLLLLYLVFFNRDAGNYWTLAALAMSVGGFALLISRLPRQRDDDDGARL